MSRENSYDSFVDITSFFIFLTFSNDVITIDSLSVTLDRGFVTIIN